MDHQHREHSIKINLSLHFKRKKASSDQHFGGLSAGCKTSARGLGLGVRAPGSRNGWVRVRQDSL